MVNLTYAGRMYQNPHDKKEIWINVGWYELQEQNVQVFPDYDEKLAPYVSHQTYNDLVQFLKDTLEQHKPCMDGCDALYICCLTLGIFFCPLLYVKYEYEEGQENMINAFKEQHVCEELEVSLRFVKDTEPTRATSNTSWVDSTGKELIFVNEREGSKKFSGPGGPPPGVNMIIKLPVEIPWLTPLFNVAPSAPPVGEVQFYPPPPLSDAPPSYDAPSYIPPSYPLLPKIEVGQHPTTSGRNFCGQCGSKITGGNFCTSCGMRI